MMRNVVAKFSAIAIACTISLAAQAVAESRARLEIPAGELISALKSLATQLDIELIYQPEQLRNMRTEGVQGTYSLEKALAILLRGTALEVHTDTSGAMVIAPPTAPKAPPQPSANTKAEGQVIELEEVVVTGSHIRGAEVAGSRVLVIDREEIDQSGYGRLQDLLEVLPQNFSGISEDSNQGDAANPNRGADVQLRGLGPGTTLTLVNGLRQPAGGTVAAFTDISGIPAAAIERIEVLADGASAIYGSDAIGGVVNFILRKDYEGAESRVRLGTSGGEADELQIAQLFGTHWSTGHVLVGYQYSERGSLPRSSRTYSSTNGDLRSFGGNDFRTTNSSPGNILNSAGQIAFAIPANQDGRDLSVADLIPGESNYRDVSYVDILPDQTIHSAFSSMSQSIGDQVELLADARYSRREMERTIPGAVATVSVPSTNPFYVNPFGGSGAVRVRYDFTEDLGPGRQLGQTETYTVNLGAAVNFGNDWRVTPSLSYGRETNELLLINQINNTAALNAALRNSNPETALNVFGDGGNTNPATLEALRGSNLDEATSTVWSAGLIADGELFETWAGPIRAALGTDFRSEKFSLDESEYVASADTEFETTSSDRNVSAVFSEIALPLVGERQARSGLRRLEVSVAGRYDHYDDFGSTFNPKLGVKWVPWTGMGVRGTWGTAFRAPPFYLTNTGIRIPNASTGNVTDPTSPTGQTKAISIFGTQSDLTEETAEVWTAGIDLAIRQNLSLSLTYFDIAYSDKIETPGPIGTILAVENRYAGTGVITRNPTPAQVDAICSESYMVSNADCTGTIGAIIDYRARNLALVDVKGMDVDLGYGLETSLGQVRFAVRGTYTFSHDQAVSEASPTVDVVNTYSYPLELRVRGTTAWQLGAWSANAALNYAGSYDAPGVTPSNVEAWTTIDLGIGYEFNAGTSGHSGTRLQVNVSNLFDEAPPFVNQAGVYTTGYDPANGNVIGRTTSIRFIKSW